MTHASDALETCLGELILNGDVSTPTNLIAYALGITQAVNSSNLYVSLHTTPTSGDGPGSEVNTTEYPGYARAAVRREKSFSGAGTSKWTHALGSNIGLFNNAEAINFPIVGSGGTGATVVAWGIYDAATGGNKLFYGPIIASGASLKVGYHTGDDDTGSTDLRFVFSAAHGLSNSDTIRCYMLYDGQLGNGSAAGGAQAGTLATVSSVSIDSFKIDFDLSNTGGILFVKAGSISISAGKIPAIPALGMGVRFA